MSKSPKGEESSVALTNTEQIQEGSNERFVHKFNNVKTERARSIDKLG